MEYMEHAVEEDRIMPVALSFANHRLDGETFEEYRFRRAYMKQEIKHYKKGRLVWDPYRYGITRGISYLKNEK